MVVFSFVPKVGVHSEILAQDVNMEYGHLGVCRREWPGSSGGNWGGSEAGDPRSLQRLFQLLKHLLKQDCVPGRP
jgi:hypothetical protein